eukprot:GFYU01009074.1.p1 GENE.GFYU01009074.1~~GFYU01009074.1.p1  ORF type:complete len:420 (-),score=110.91 GFYU01009074.1:114-1373(-)
MGNRPSMNADNSGGIEHNWEGHQSTGYGGTTPMNTDSYNGHGAASGSDYVQPMDIDQKRQSLKPGEEESDVLPGTKKVSIADFDLLKTIGKGSYGKVLKVRKLDNNKIYALKIIKKEAVVRRNHVEHTKAERSILQLIRHPFIVGLQYAFQTAEKLYLVIDFMEGGELFFHLKREKKFSEDRVRLYAAEIVLALEHLHRVKVIYRDLKPENILLDNTGHIRLTDFGLCKDNMEFGENTHTFCGTPEYLAPEMLQGTGHSMAVDWWSFGTLVYEMLSGLPPFYSQNLNLMYRKILYEDLRIPDHLSPEAKDLLRGLLERDPNKRLGGGAADAGPIKAHPFFAKLDWEMVYRKHYDPPFKPSLHKRPDQDNFDPIFTNLPAVDSPVDKAPLSTSQGDDNQFEGFTYVTPSHLGGVGSPPFK